MNCSFSFLLYVVNTIYFFSNIDLAIKMAIDTGMAIKTQILCYFINF